MNYNYLISSSMDYVGNEYVPVTRIFNASVVTCDPEEYNLECGEYWTDTKPTQADLAENELLYDMTNQ